MAKNGQKRLSYAIESSSVLVVSMVISPELKTADEIKMDAVSRKFCLVSRGVILFLVSLILFEKNYFS